MRPKKQKKRSTRQYGWIHAMLNDTIYHDFVNKANAGGIRIAAIQLDLSTNTDCLTCVFPVMFSHTFLFTSNFLPNFFKFAVILFFNDYCMYIVLICLVIVINYFQKLSINLAYLIYINKTDVYFIKVFWLYFCLLMS